MTFKKYIRNLMICCMTVWMLVSVFSVSIAEANGFPVNKNIRVGLLFDQGNHLQAVPYVTLSSPTGLELSDTQQAASPFISVFPYEETIVHLDRYYIAFTDTNNLQQAEAVYNGLKEKNHRPYIVQETLMNEIRYQVIVGHFNSESQAMESANRIAAESAYSGTVYGNFRVEAGTFADRQGADLLVAELRSQGYAAYLVIDRQNGAVTYRVWVGNGESQNSAARLMEQLQAAFADRTFVIAPQGASSILLKSAYVDGKSLQVAAISGQSPKIMARATAGVGVPVVKVNERSNRYYRGVIELSLHNGKLAVINELPLEEYLYGVVPREMVTGWPLEALKAQAVVARTYALNSNRWVIAHVVDDEKDQAYWGYGIEAPDASQAVDETYGEVLRLENGQLIEAFYSSNSGGMTASGYEVWGNDVPYLRSVASPDDVAVLETTAKWYHVVLKNGLFGYIHSDYLVKNGEYNQAGFPLAAVQGMEVNVRANADIYHEILTKVNTGDMAVILEEVYENNAYSWRKGPYTPEKMAEMINANQQTTNQRIAGPVWDLQVSKRGDSGRVLEVTANGNVVPVSSPDAHRSLFRDGSSLRSTQFVIEGQGEYTILGANGAQVTYPKNGTSAILYATDSQGQAGSKANPVNGNQQNFVVINNLGDVRVASKSQAYVFVGTGYGHGFGLSQWGAHGMANKRDGFGNLVYTYKDILTHYYSDQVYLDVAQYQ